MSIRVNVEPSGLFKKCPELRECIKPEYRYGVWDKSCRLEEDITGEYTLVYKKDEIARGIILQRANHFVSVTYTEPTSKAEIYDFYEYVRFLCEKLDVKKFTQNGEPYKIDDIPKLFEEGIERAGEELQKLEQQVLSGEVPCVYIFGAKHPVALDRKKIDEIGTNLTKFAEFLHDSQKDNMYYSAAEIRLARQFTKKEIKLRSEPKTKKRVTPEVILKYEVPCDKPVIFPTVTRIFVTEPVIVKGKEVLIKYSDSDFESVSYDLFKEQIDTSREYDSEHCIIQFSKDELKAIAEKCNNRK